MKNVIRIGTETVPIFLCKGFAASVRGLYKEGRLYKKGTDL